MMGGWWLEAVVATPGPIKVTCAEIGNCSTKTKNLGQGFANIANTLILVIGALAVIFVIYSGLQIALSSGNAKRVQQGRESLMYSLAGVVLAVAAYAIVAGIAGAFN